MAHGTRSKKGKCLTAGPRSGDDSFSLFCELPAVLCHARAGGNMRGALYVAVTIRRGNCRGRVALVDRDEAVCVLLVPPKRQRSKPLSKEMKRERFVSPRTGIS